MKYEESNGDNSGNQDQDVLRCVFQSGNKLYALDGREDRDGRSDDTVADQEADADIGEEGDKCKCSPRFDHSDQDFAQHNGAALSLASQTHGQPGVFDHDKDNERPDDQ